MGYGLYLADIETFDDLIDWLEEHIKESISSLNAESSPKNLRKVLKSIIDSKCKEQIQTYGWTGEEEIPDLVATNLFHEIFAAYNKHLYVYWYRKNYEELEEDNPFHYENSNEAFKTLNALYREEEVELSNRLLVQEIKRGIHTKLFSVMQSLEYTLESETNLVSVNLSEEKHENPVADELKKVLEEVLKLEEQLDKVVNTIEVLDYSRNEY
ncbi:hypothetical protein ABE41_017325 [Fictibacillus arsenicus]|uniref:Uncharacterized protein n=1 Tax=Fictibacillus arsenicus TaxID=255247 RepID=A0A1B1Z8J2_9BACL|nr:hypothetical protein [Fictibacillus arsenicus]ANX13774.1 hypothetical protein ABE41_017325 [Fictibacillus arsenicus]